MHVGYPLGLVSLWTFMGCAAVVGGYSMSSNMEYCLSETFNATCDVDTVVLMMEATFGSMNTGRCSSSAHHCQQDIIDYADARCSGRHHCHFDVIDIIGEGIQPCQNDVMPYLLATYDCIAVTSTMDHQCFTSPTTKVPELNSYLSSVISAEENVGTEECPWRIQAENGQHIAITLIDFGIWERRVEGRDDITHCDKYAILSEDTAQRQTSVCGGDQRIHHHLYQSKTSLLDVSVIPSTTSDRKHFLIKYEVIGCKMYVASEGTRADIKGDIALVTCIATDSSWQVTCVDTVWVEDTIHECDNGDVAYQWVSGQGFLLVMCIGVIFGIVIGLVFLFVAVICIRKRQRAARESNSTTEELYMQHQPIRQEQDNNVYGQHRQPPQNEEIYAQHRPVQQNQEIYAQHRQIAQPNQDLYAQHRQIQQNQDIYAQPRHVQQDPSIYMQHRQLQLRQQADVYMQHRAIRQDPEYNYKYTPGMNRPVPFDPFLQRSHVCTFIDPETGIIYERHISPKTEVIYSTVGDNRRTYRAAAPGDARNHVYYTLEPRAHSSANGT